MFHDGPHRTIADIEYATAGWVGWYKTRELHSSISYVPSAEFEQPHYAILDREPQPAYQRPTTWGASSTLPDTEPQKRAARLHTA